MGIFKLNRQQEMKTKDKTDVDILIDYIKKHSVLPTHSPQFTETIERLFHVKAREGSLKKIELAEIEGDINTIKAETGKYPIDLAFKYNRLYSGYTEKPCLTRDATTTQVFFDYIKNPK